MATHMKAIIIQIHKSGTKANSSKETTSTKNVAEVVLGHYFRVTLHKM